MLEAKTKNGKYAVEALKFINKDIFTKELWEKVLIATKENLNKTHNKQMDVVKILFNNNELIENFVKEEKINILKGEK